eukprot:5580148-Prymnesium_polylepis.1
MSLLDYVEDILDRLRASLKKRGAEGIRGLAKHFKICDTQPQDGTLNRDEFQKCMNINKMPLNADETDALFSVFDRDGGGGISYEEFLQALRRLTPARRALVVRVFDVLDRSQPGGSKGKLTVDAFKDVYSTSKHPKVQSGAMTKQEALREFLSAFEGSRGNRDGVVTWEEWLGYYEEVSASIDSDDYFGQMMVSTWSHLKRKNADGSRSAAITYVPSSEVERLQADLKASIYQKSSACDQRKVAEKAFKVMDLDGSGNVSMGEFKKALERFGLHVVPERDSGVRAPPGGYSQEVVAALFARFDADGSGALEYKEFCNS